VALSQKDLIQETREFIESKTEKGFFFFLLFQELFPTFIK